MGALKVNSGKCFRKPWGGIHSTEMIFKNMIFEQMKMTMEDKGVGDFSKDIGDH
jgi:hypothetical protein